MQSLVPALYPMLKDKWALVTGATAGDTGMATGGTRTADGWAALPQPRSGRSG